MDFLRFNMNGTSAMPGKMAEILRDRRQIAVLDMGSAFSWSISGKGAPAGMLTDMDFAIRRGPGTVPEELLREKAGKNPCAQLRLAQEGAFGPEAVLVMQTGNVSWAVADAGTGGAAGSAQRQVQPDMEAAWQEKRNMPGCMQICICMTRQKARWNLRERDRLHRTGLCTLPLRTVRAMLSS